jgi:hypothetical protein
LRAWLFSSKAASNFLPAKFAHPVRGGRAWYSLRQMAQTSAPQRQTLNQAPPSSPAPQSTQVIMHTAHPVPSEHEGRRARDRD